MAVTWYTSAGTPNDNVGVQGDMVWDFQNRFIWGPKTATTWVGTANGAAPLTANLGPAAYGQGAPSVFAGTLTSTPQLMTNPITGQPTGFTPLVNTVLFGALVSSGVAGTLELYNLTTSTSVYSGQSFAGSATAYGSGQPYQPTQYVLQANNTYVWRVTGTASGASIVVWPCISVPAQGVGQAISSVGPVQFSANTSFTSATQVPFIGLSTVPFYWRPLRATSYIYNITATFTPTGSSTAASYVNVYVNYSGASQSFYGIGKAFGTGKPTVFGPFPPGQIPIVNGNQYWFNVNADTNCTGTLTLDFQVVL